MLFIKTGKFAFSFAANPIAGDGKTKYSDGLPSSELYMSDVVQVVKEYTQYSRCTLTNIVAATSVDGDYDNITVMSC